MLNKRNERELAYVVSIDGIEPIEGSDNCEAAVVGGWKIMVRKGTFKSGDLAVYFEIDSRVPPTAAFDFLKTKHYAVKTQKYTFGGKGKFISQGLLMSFGDLPEFFDLEVDGWCYKKSRAFVKEGDFLTKMLRVTYYIPEDNERKSSIDKYQKMKDRHSELFKKHRFLRELYNYKWGKKLLFLFLGKKKDNQGWPNWVSKTDEERCQNLPHLFPGDDTPWTVTEKIDGSSSSFTLHRKKGYFVCSRNVCFTKERGVECYYKTNIYLEMSEKYKIEEVLNKMMQKDKKIEFITLQGETFGDGVQKRSYGLTNGEHDFRAFNLIFKMKGEEPFRLNPTEMAAALEDYSIPTVPILDINFKLPNSCEELLAYAEGVSELDGGPREGIVLRTFDGVNSFKAVSNAFLLDFHS